MAKLLDQSLTEKDGFCPMHLSALYLRWWQSDGFDTGAVFAAVFSGIEAGVEPARAVKRAHQDLQGQTAGCNPAHRIMPLALHSCIATCDIGTVARQEAQITHYDPIAGDMAALSAYLCRLLIEGYSWEEAKELTCDLEPEAWRVMQGAKLSRDGFAPNVLHTALMFLDADSSIDRAIMFAGPNNYCPVIVAPIAALRGDQIPQVNGV